MRKELIYKIIQEKPGIFYNEIVRDANLSNGVISHYLIQLLNDKKIQKYGINRSKYFLTHISEKNMKLITILRNKTNNDICKNMIKNSSKKDFKYTPLSAYEISKIINKSKSTVSVSLKILFENKIIDRTIMNKKTKLTNDIGYVIINRNFWTKFFEEYKL